MRQRKIPNMGGEYVSFETFIKQSICRNEQAAKKILAERRQEKISKLLHDSGLGQKFLHRTFETFKINERNEDAFRTAKQFANEFKAQKKGLLFSGTVGSGKTHLAASIANQLISELHSVIFGNITDIITRIYDTYSAESDIRTGQIIKALTSVDLLVLDDLGKEGDSRNINTVLYQIINARYEHELKVIITTNLTSSELSSKIGNATVSRITEMTTPVILNDKDWRIG